MVTGEDRQDQLLRSARKAHSDLKLIERAIAEDWPIAPELQQYIAGELGKFIRDHRTEGKEIDQTWLRATQQIISMTGQNLQRLDKRSRLIPKLLEMECLGVFGPPVPKGVTNNGKTPEGDGDQPEDGEELNVVPMGELIQQLVLNDPQFIDYCRDRAAEEDLVASDIREPRQQGLMAVRSPPEDA